MEKLEGYEFWEKTLKKARLVVAPMVDQSELPWRLLSRRHGAELCYSPMYHAQLMVRDPSYRREALKTCPEDRPLIVQLCANNPETFVQAAKFAEPYCDAVDLNLGCPQTIAKRGHYGAFLQDEWDLVYEMLNRAHKELSVPVTCKIRVFNDLDKTVRYAQMVERAGIQLLTVHGRTREMKGTNTGLADWNAIKAVKNAVKIPVFANGNIQSVDDIKRCFEETGVDGIMTAEGNLHNPLLFEGTNPPIWEPALEYLSIVKEYPVPMSHVRGHLFKMFLHMLEKHVDLREILGKSKTIEGVERICYDVKRRAEEDMKLGKGDGQKIPHWLCQPYFRPSAEELLKRAAERAKNPKRKIDPEEQRRRHKVKKTSPDPRVRLKEKEDKYEKCSVCRNPRGQKCVFKLCRVCCKGKSFWMKADCPSHNLMFKSKEAKRKYWEATQRAKQEAEAKNSMEGNSNNSANNREKDPECGKENEISDRVGSKDVIMCPQKTESCVPGRNTEELDLSEKASERQENVATSINTSSIYTSDDVALNVVPREQRGVKRGLDT